MAPWPVYEDKEEPHDDPVWTRPPPPPVPQEWDTYDERPGAQPVNRDVGAAPRRLPPPMLPTSRGLTGLVLGNRFDDASWRSVLRRRGWREAAVNGLPGFESPVLADGTTVLFCAPELSAGGLDDTPFLFGFRRGGLPSGDELWKVIPHGDGELVFDRLAHATSGFDRAAFLRWLSAESMADSTRL